MRTKSIIRAWPNMEKTGSIISPHHDMMSQNGPDLFHDRLSIPLLECGIDRVHQWNGKSIME